MTPLLPRFLLNIKHLERDKTYLAGLSGGRDSMVLWHLLQQAGFSNIVLCHLHHGTRKTADRDWDFVQNVAKISQTRVINDRFSPPKLGKTTESVLRQARLEFFARVAQETTAVGVFLGHHADDLAETFLWNLLRGSGAAGLSGIQAEQELQTASGPIRLFRPMLHLWRSEIDTFVLEHQIDFVEDESNRSRKYTRNRLRHDILPWLEEKLGRQVRQNLLRTATILSEENSFLEKQLPPITWRAPLSVAELQMQPIALQRRIILKWLQTNDICEAGFEEVELIRSLLDLANSPARVNLPKNRQARRRAGKISLARQSD